MDTLLGVGDRARRSAGLGIVGSLTVAGAFAVYTVVTKQTPQLYRYQPWQDDPYDALVSFDFIALPLLVIIGALRTQLCRRHEALPVRRVVDLLRLSGVTTGLVLATEIAEWWAVAQGVHRAQWNAVTGWQTTVLAALTGATIGSAGFLRRAHHGLARSTRPAAQPDWLTDALALALRETRLLGPFRDAARSAVQWVERQIIGRVRAQPIAAAALFAVVLALPEAAAKVVLEHYPAPLVLLVFGVSTASLFAFTVVAGSYLRVIAPRHERPSIWLCAAVVTCLAGPLAGAFRDPLLRVIGVDESHQTVGGLAGLILGVGVLAGVVTLVGQSTFRCVRSDQR